MAQSIPIRVGVSGTGFIARGLVRLLNNMPDRYRVSAVFSRRPLHEVTGLDAPLTGDLQRLIQNTDCIVECSGTVGGAARVVAEASARSIPVITMNAEFQVTVGAAFSGHSIAEAQGDQPGSLALLYHEAVSMGFEPLVLGSQKGFLDHNPTPEQMRYWSRRNGMSMSATTSFTDGTKIQIEQALVANGLNAGILQDGLIGPKAPSLQAGGEGLAKLAEQANSLVADYVLYPEGKGEVFIMARHPDAAAALQYFKLGDGPYYMLQRPNHLGHLELPLSIDRMMAGERPLLTAGHQPQISVAALAKRPLKAGKFIARGIGSFDFRGHAVRAADYPAHVPIGLLENCRITRDIDKGETLSWGDVALSDGRALQLYQSIIQTAPTAVAI